MEETEQVQNLKDLVIRQDQQINLLKIEASTAKAEQKRQFEEDQRAIKSLQGIIADSKVLNGKNIERISSLQASLLDVGKEAIRLQGKVKEAWFASQRNAKIANSRVLKGSTINLQTFEQWSKENNINRAKE